MSESEINRKLRYAVIGNFPDDLKEAIEQGADPNEPNEHGLTPLHTAVRLGHEQIAVLLMGYGANPNETNRFGDTPLHDAAAAGKVNMIQLLVARGAHVHARNRDGCQPIHQAAKNDELDAGRALLSFGADLYSRDWSNKTAIDWANEERWHFLIEESSPNEPKPGSRALNDALILALQQKNSDLVRKLLSQGADPNAREEGKPDGMPALAFVRTADSLEALLTHGADPNAKTPTGQPAMYVIAANADDQCVAFLIDQVDEFRPLDHLELVKAVERENFEALAALFAMGADFNVLKYGETGPPLLACARSMTMLDYLIKHGASPQKTDHNGATALHYFAGWVEDDDRRLHDDPEDMVVELVKAEANVNAVDHAGAQPLHWAAAAGNRGVIRDLLELGADPQALDLAGKLPWDHFKLKDSAQDQKKDRGHDLDWQIG